MAQPSVSALPEEAELLLCELSSSGDSMAVPSLAYLTVRYDNGHSPKHPLYLPKAAPHSSFLGGRPD